MANNPAAERGIVTIATGRQVYLDMARDLALSLKRHSPRIPRAILTDSTQPWIAELFDVVIPLEERFGRGLYQKLCLDLYSPFEKTLYIDSDSLVTRDVEFLWELYADQVVGFAGHSISEGHWYTDIPTLLQKHGLRSIPQLNGGMLFFARGAAPSRVLARARQIYLDEIGFPFDPWANSRTDEICLSIAFAEEGIAPLPDDGATMCTPIGIVGAMDIDVLDGRCRFLKGSTAVAPAIAHFATWQFHPVYYRERAKLRLHCEYRLPVALARVGATAVYWRERLLAAMSGR